MQIECGKGLLTLTLEGSNCIGAYGINSIRRSVADSSSQAHINPFKCSKINIFRIFEAYTDRQAGLRIRGPVAR
jgi:hypothetical protein